MKLAIHQPNFIPWIGYFYKILISDAFVFLDDAQYTKNSYINRNRIKTPAGEQWLTVPVKKMPLNTPINQIEISGHRQLKKILKTIKVNYARAPYFDELFPKIETVLLSGTCLLTEINIALVKLMLKELKIQKPIYNASELSDIEGTQTDRLVSICKALDADYYISGYGGEKYQSAEIFASNNITVETYSFKHPGYEQLWNGVIKNLSIIDLVFNKGKESGEILRNSSAKDKTLILSDE